MSAPRWAEVTAILGGTFDPPHEGHREALRGLFRTPGVGRVLVMPAAAPPHKPTVATAEQRLEMARLAFEGLGDVEVDGSELERARRTGRPSYSFETLSELAPRHKQLAFVIGTDQLRDLPQWFRFPEVLGLSHWIVLTRKPDGEAIAAKALKELEASGLLAKQADRLWKIKVPGHKGDRWLTVQPTDAPALSSTAVREALGRTGKPPQDALSEPVLGYLKQHRLYGTDKDLL
jgi:nicotinate-nucleotide adenylyltransferase